MNLENLILQLEKNIPNANVKVESASKRGVDWHIDHSLKVLIGVYKTMYKSKEEDYKWKFNFYRTTLLSLGYFPRAKVRAPKAVNNKEEIKAEDLLTQLQLVKELVNSQSKLKPKSNFLHPYFGLLDLKQSQRFMIVHTNHHLKIINDILKSAK